MKAHPKIHPHRRRGQRQILALWLICLILMLISCQTAQNDTIEWRFALEEIKGGVQDAYATRFKQLIEEKSAGKIKVSIYPYGTLGTSDQITELVNNGAVHFAMASPGHLGKLIPEIQVLLLHFLFSDSDQVNQKVFSKLQSVKIFDELYGEKGLKFLAVYPEGWMAWTTRDKVETPEDFKGVKFRVMTSPLLLSSYQSYGASPISMPYSEVYSALQLKMIDGQVNPVFAIEEMSFYEVTDHMIFPRHAQFVTTAVASQKFYRALSPELKDMVQQTILELNDYIYQVQDEFNSERLDKIKANSEIKITTLNSEQRQAFADLYAPVQEQFIQSASPRGKALLEEIQSLVTEVEASKADPTPQY